MRKKRNYDEQDLFSPNSILIVNKHNRLKTHTCPFKVQAKYDIGAFKKGQYATVEEIKQTQFEKIVFVILKKAYYPTHWEIL